MDKIINEVSEQACDEFWSSYLNDIVLDLMRLSNIKTYEPEYFKSIKILKQLEKLSLSIAIAYETCKISKFWGTINKYKEQFAKLCEVKE
jgi:hypothetical protein